MSFFHILSKRSFLFVWLISVYTAQALSTNDGGVLKLNLHRRQLNSNKKASVDVLLDDGFWFTNISVGSSDPLELLVDTGSADLVLNPGRYKRSSSALNLNNTFEVTYGTTTGNGAGSSSQTITGAIYNDTVSISSLKLSSQTIGSIVSNSSNSSNVQTYPHDGIIGFGSEGFSGTNSTPFFHNLCEQNLVSECRFGLQLDSNGTGSLTLGGVADGIPGGEKNLTKVPIIEEWFIAGDLAVNGKIVQSDLVIEMDSGSSGIVGSIDAVSTLFEEIGIQGVLQASPTGDVLIGYFPCRSNATQSSVVGFSFPSASNISAATSLGGNIPISNTSRIFNIPADAMSLGSVDASGTNCTSVISGFDVPDLPGLWVAGQAFFQGKYVDHSLDDGSIGLADLTSGSNITSVTSPSPPNQPSQKSAGNANRDSYPILLGSTFLLLVVLQFGWIR